MADDEPRMIRVPFDGAPKLPAPGPDGEVAWVREIHLTRETVAVRTAGGDVEFTKAWSIYPAAVVDGGPKLGIVLQARYSGTYEGGMWLAFPCGASTLAEPFWRGWRGSDVECFEFWQQAEQEKWPIGRGPDPSAAYSDLVARVCELAGVKPDMAA